MLKISANSLRVLCAWLPFLWIGHTLATNQSIGRTPQSKDWKKIICKLVIYISSAQCFRIYGDMGSGPQALLVSSAKSRCCIPDIVIVILGIDDIGPLELSIGGICDRSLLVKTEVVV